jgi:import inner membrane translocase subunit TIM23
MAIGAASAAVGLLAGSNVFRLVHSSRKALLDAKEKDFFNRLVKHRPKDIKFLAVPGSGETLTLPDYYGEKINSVADYRKWIRKQKRFIARNVVGR